MLLSEQLHPTIVSRIIDASESTAEVVSDDTTIVFGIITSDRGEANVIREWYSHTDMIQEYGEPDYNVHGYVYYNLIKAVKNGAKALVMRAVPIDNPDRPEIVSGSYANAFLDIQTKAIIDASVEAPAQRVVSATAVVAADPLFPSEDKVTDVALVVDRIKPGSTVYFEEETTAALAGDGDIVLRYWATSSNFSTVGLVNADVVTLKFATGDVVATISADNGVSGITKYSMLLEAATDISTTEQVLLEKAGVAIGYVTAIVRVGKVTTAQPTFDNFLNLKSGMPIVTSAPATYEVFNGKAITDTEFYVSEVADIIANTPAVDILAKIQTTVTSSADITVTEFNVLAFNDTPALPVNLLFDFEGYGPVVEVRPVIISKKTDSTAELAAFMKNPTSDPLINDTEDGFTRHVFFGLNKGMSLEENKYGFRLSSNDKYDADSEGFRLFNIEITENIAGVDSVIDGPYIVSLDSHAVDSRNQPYWINAMLDKYSGFFDSYYNVDIYNELLEDLRAAADSVAVDINPGNYDFLLDTERDVVKNVLEQEFIEVVNDQFDISGLFYDTKDLGGSATFPSYKEKLFVDKSFTTESGAVSENLTAFTTMDIGSSGSLDGYDANGVLLTPSQIRTMKEDVIIDGYTGLLNGEIFNKSSYPMDAVFDGMQSAKVKLAMVDFVKNSQRQDCLAYLDSLESPSYISDLSFREGDLSGIDTYLAAIYGQSYVVYDEYTESNMRTSLLDFIAKKLPEHDKNKGSHFPIAGPGGIVTGYVKGSLSYNPNDNQMENLYKARVNYAVKDNESQCRFMSQNTAQKKNSALTNISVVRTLLKMKREVELLAKNYQFNFKDTILTGYRSDITDALNKYSQNGAIETFSVSLYASDYDLRQKRINIKIEVKFSELIESFFIDWIVKL